VPGLTKDQVELCYKASDVTAAALEGLDMAIRECQIQVGKQNRKISFKLKRKNQIVRDITVKIIKF